jgi:hypothetical protein
LSYEDRLRRLKLPSLSYRRSRGDMIEVYKIMSGKYDPEISNIFQHQEQENRNTRGHKYKLFKPRCRLNIRKNSFCIRVVNMWNSLSENVVTANTLLTFERRLDRYWENQDQFYNYRAVITTGQDSLESDSEETELVQEADDCLLPDLGRRGFVSIFRAISLTSVGKPPYFVYLVYIWHCRIKLFLRHLSNCPCSNFSRYIYLFQEISPRIAKQLRF